MEEKIRKDFYSEFKQNSQKLNKAMREKNDEFYTLYNSVEYYVKTFLQNNLKDKIIYCNCDSEESNFVKYFKEHKEELQYKELWYTWDDYRNHFDLLDKCDIIITNPPFSIFTKYYFPDILKSGKEYFIIAPITFLMRTKFLPMIFDGRIKLFKPDHYQYKGIKIANYLCPNGEIKEIGTLVLSNLQDFKNCRLYTKGFIYQKELQYKFENIPHDYIEDDREILNINQINYMPKDYSGLMAIPTTNIYLYLHLIDILEIPKKSLRCNGKNLFTRVLVKLKNPEI